jgi:hypothetical protein
MLILKNICKTSYRPTLGFLFLHKSMKRMSVGVALKNRYWVVRHGKSIPNERGLIVSSIQNGILSQFQLAPDGVIQAQRAANSFQKVLFFLSFT